MGARISRDRLSDRSLDRAVRALSAQTIALGALIHRYDGDDQEAEVADSLRADEDALSEVLGILLHEQRYRRFDDRVTTALNAADAADAARTSAGAIASTPASAPTTNRPESLYS